MSKFLNQDRTTVKSGKSIDDAVEAALKELGASRDDVEIDIMQQPAKGFLGLGAKDAVVKVTAKAHEVPEVPEVPEVEETVTNADAPKPRQQRSGQRNRNRRRSGQKRPQRDREAAAAEVTGIVKPYVPTTFATPSKEDDPVTAAKTFLTSMFAAMQIDVEADVSLDGDMMTVNLAGDNMGIVIGKRGDTLDSLQYLTSLVVNRRNKDDYIKVTIDTENYREKRADALVALSNRLADKVTRSGKKFTLEPMNPYERRIIHANLQDNENVTTFSVGSEPYRKVVIAPKNARPRRDNRGGRRPSAPRRDSAPKTSAVKAERTGSYTTTYKADFKPTPHKAEYHSYEEYLAAQNGDIIPPVNTDNTNED